MLYAKGHAMSLTRAEIDALRKEDGLPPSSDDVMAKLFADFGEVFRKYQRLPLFGQAVRQPLFDKEGTK